MPLVNFFALFVSVFFLMTGIGLLGTYLPFSMSSDGIEPSIIGGVTSAYYFGMFVGAFTSTAIIRQVGHIRAFAAFAALTTAIVMGHALYGAPFFWGVLRFLCGIAAIGLFTVVESWLNEMTEPNRRGRIMSIYMIISYLGMVAGQLMLNLAGTKEMGIFLIVGLMLSLCIVPLSTTRSVHPQIPGLKKISIYKIIKKSPIGVFGCLTAGLVNGAFYSIGPVFCHNIGLSVSQLSLVMGITISGGLALQRPIGLISDRFDRAYVLVVVSAVASSLSVAVISMAELSFSHLVSVMAFFGGFSFVLYPVSVARAHDLFDTEDIIPVSSTLLLSYAVGATVGPVIGSLAMKLGYGPYGLFIYCAVVQICFAATAFYLRNRELVTVVAAEENAPFVIMKDTSAYAVYIDPRTDEDLQNGSGDRDRE
ncbi:MFS transporter [Desulforhopalus singaporensis]|uniref:Predicted arabinose efflux permease, MFS family n=1 Tax=Desulforhopalus singaporensis TaxID=91360 RepID=A0A1H0TCU9_9BACT|nr:MFS transporter [Desulforhopalus singaporensis]SDP51837.1 Predicted arabinose efflux permease, MFS family [Desulforhopalus singaporensis]